jgi:hypothetical protein
VFVDLISEPQATSAPKSTEGRRRPHINSVLGDKDPHSNNMAYFVGPPISQTNETMGRCPHLERARNSSSLSSSILDQACMFSLSTLVDVGSNDSSSVYHTHKSFTSNHSLGRIRSRYRANY